MQFGTISWCWLQLPTQRTTPAADCRRLVELYPKIIRSFLLHALAMSWQMPMSSPISNLPATSLSRILPKKEQKNASRCCNYHTACMSADGGYFQGSALSLPECRHGVEEWLYWLHVVEWVCLLFMCLENNEVASYLADYYHQNVLPNARPASNAMEHNRMEDMGQWLLEYGGTEEDAMPTLHWKYWVGGCLGQCNWNWGYFRLRNNFGA